MRRHFRNLNLELSTWSNPESSAQRRDFRRDDAYELGSESQTELHHNKINVEYVYEIKHSCEEVGSPTANSESSSKNGSGKAHFLVSEEGTYPSLLELTAGLQHYHLPNLYQKTSRMFRLLIPPQSLGVTRPLR
jgi:hypothetical protein